MTSLNMDPHVAAIRPVPRTRTVARIVCGSAPRGSTYGCA